MQEAGPGVKAPDGLDIRFGFDAAAPADGTAVLAFDRERRVTFTVSVDVAAMRRAIDGMTVAMDQMGRAIRATFARMLMPTDDEWARDWYRAPESAWWEA